MMPQNSSSKFKEGGRQMQLSYHCWDNCNPSCAFRASGILKTVKFREKKIKKSILLNTTYIFIA